MASWYHTEVEWTADVSSERACEALADLSGRRLDVFEPAAGFSRRFSRFLPPPPAPWVNDSRRRNAGQKACQREEARA
jgi:hypothetical protein